jgi:MFS family permease
MRLVPLLYLSSYALSMLGNSIAAIALPLLVLQSTGSLMSTGVLAAASSIPAFFVGLVAGVVIDRINRRTSSVVADLISAGSIAALPVIDLVTGLNLGWFLLFGILGSLGDVPGMTAREALLPAIVRSSSLSPERLMGLREGIGALVMIVGPAAAGTLIAFFDGSAVLWITAATSLAGALLTLLIPRAVGVIQPAEQSDPTSAWGQLRQGWRVLLRTNPFLRAVTLLNLVLIAVVASLQGILLPAHFTLINEPALLGFVLTFLALGTLVGAGIYALLAGRGRRRPWFVIGLLGTVAGMTAIAILPPSAVLFAGAFVLGLSSGLFSSLLGVLMLEAIPERMRGRIMGTQNSLMMLAAPAGMVLVAVVGDRFSLGTAGILLAVLWAVAAVIALIAPALRNLEPTTEEAADAKQ